MHAIWFAMLSSMLTAYAVLDGFDFGAGVVHLFVAKTEEERGRILAAIGPFWDGNEVWLVASGGVFFFAFPRAYAAAFSGLYLPLVIVLWLLVLRGLSIEFRSILANPLWRSGWDTVFSVASSVMALVLGVALGNVIRGVPLGNDGTFHEDLFAIAGPAVGAIDPFTALYGLFALCALAAHGATFVLWKTEGALAVRSRKAARILWIITFVLGAVVMGSTALSQPTFLDHLVARPWLWPMPAWTITAAAITLRSLATHREGHAFAGSCGFLASLLLTAAGALYPTILRSTIDEAYTLDSTNAGSAPAALGVALGVTLFALALAVSYFVYLFRAFEGKVRSADTSRIH
ncbi:MAG TPA: cytochrome d ubiquinol oxidase subunit II [Polyangiaceae bacterium]|jgi:cytochrome d ubiquinol oxidase subunit II|nr:cytochrome d ubiquinol oxidase subunit II [Polyangiaceae bacterium]